MIICQSCNNNNKLGTIYCRKCGTKLIVDMAAIERSVASSIKSANDSALLRSAHSSIALCTFALLCACVYRYVVVPAMPPTVLPPSPVVSLFPQTTEVQNNTTTSNIGSEPNNTKGRFTSWRQSQSQTLMKTLTIDYGQLRIWHDSLLKSVNDEGVVNQANQFAATALTALALQAWPHDQNTLNTVLRMQTWMRSQTNSLSRQDRITSALVTCALADWDVLPPAIYAQMEIPLLDGNAAPWQLWFLPLRTSEQRTLEFAALRKAADHQIWLGYLKLFDPNNTAAIPLNKISPLTLTTGEHRMAWSFSAWSSANDPELLRNTLIAWSQQDPAPVQAELSTLCGPLSATAVSLLAITAPWRLPSTWLPTSHNKP
jgi:hypothetical protein